MEKSSSSIEGSTTLITLFRLLGTLMLIIGVITAILNITIYGGFTPIYWFLLAFSSFIAAICHTLFGIRRILEKK